MTTATATATALCCITCEGETNKYVNDYEGRCEKCYTKEFHPQVWRQEMEEAEWKCGDNHYCVLCAEEFKEGGGFFNHWSDNPICYECYEIEMNEEEE
jgi:hypothetical protein